MNPYAAKEKNREWFHPLARFDTIDWWSVLALLAALDVGLTAMGLPLVEGARELNPIAAAAFATGIGTAVALKAVALLMVLVVVVELEREYPVVTRGLLAFWIAAYAMLDLFTLAQLGVGLA